ncbi:MAG TPA: hypothetical protein VFE47_06905 [Tepidisphaeraceae bacterium]|nr:hypothetical protein [Tepidisphaeraceae bacterium]
MNPLATLRPLKDRFLAAVDSIKINSISHRSHDGCEQIIKHRNGFAPPVAVLANLYFGAAHIPIRFQCRNVGWRDWEINCFRMLNHDRFQAIALDNTTICLDQLPGKNLFVYLTGGNMTRKIVRAAGRELRRAHGLWSEPMGGWWSHGDASMSNMIYDGSTDRVRLIDFEMKHEKSLPADVRQADDLLVFLLDLLGYVPHRRWLPLAGAFLRTYARPEVIAQLRPRLVAPRGIAKIWWNVRTNAVDPRKVARRLEELGQALDAGEILTTPKPASKAKRSGFARRGASRTFAMQ